jgi:hypothetical protein
MKVPRRRWAKPQEKAQSGVLFKCAQSVKTSEGCLADEAHYEVFSTYSSFSDITYLHRDNAKTETIIKFLLESPKFIHCIGFRAIRITIIYNLTFLIQ